MKNIGQFLKDTGSLIVWLLNFIKRTLMSLLKGFLIQLRSKTFLQKIQAIEAQVIHHVHENLPAEPQKFWSLHHKKVLKIIYVVIIAMLVLNFAKCMYKPSRMAIEPVVEGELIYFNGVTKPLNGIKSSELIEGGVQNLVLPGRLVWNEEKTAKVYSPFSGRVESVEVQLGETVKKGQSLAHIQSPEFGVAQSEARKAQAAASLARSSLNRAKELYANGIIAKKDFDQIESDAAQVFAEFDRASARIKALGASYNSVNQKFPLNTPFDGIVVEKNIYPGRELNSDLSNVPLLTITDPNNLWAILEASEVDLGRFEVGAEVVIHNNTLPNEKLTGKIIQIADFIDPVTRTLKVRVEVPNQNKKLRAEMFVQADIPVTNLEGMIVPAKGIFLVGDKHYVFVELDINKYERHEVKVGKRFADKVEVIEGLKQDQKVVTEGNLYLQEILRANTRAQKGKNDQPPARLLDDVYKSITN